MTGRHSIWDGLAEVEVAVPVSGGENVMVPIIRAVVARVDDSRTILLQRRDIPDEPVRGKLEIPGGRWRAGESPIAALTREIDEETGLSISSVQGVGIDEVDQHRRLALVEPLVVVAGTVGTFPAIHVVLRAQADGDPVDAPGETVDVRWWPIRDVVEAIGRDPDGFIPSSRVAIGAYVAWLATAES